MNRKAFSRVSCGVFLLSAQGADRPQGCLVSSFHQLTPVRPWKVCVTLHREHETCRAVRESGCFAVTVLARNASAELLRRFGHTSGRRADKFEGYAVKTDGNGSPYLEDSALARFACTVLDEMKVDDYVLFVAEVTEAEILADGIPLSVDDYKNGGGSTPPTATVQRAMEERFGWRCTFCGYGVEREELPADYRCPICRAGRERFRRI